MLHPSLRRHLQTFARLRQACRDDLTALANLERCSSTTNELDWSALVADGNVAIITAHEGESLVGAAVIRHRRNSATATIAWLLVCPSARGRGVGTLLLDAAVSSARDGGAAVLVAEAASDDSLVPHLLLSSGFQRGPRQTEPVRFKRLLWQRREPGTVLRLTYT
ncbi:MAG: GNAT family N-acetyltransferase [Devosia sp.]|nr:GNAT family N-acetyltransferase [Devosia sp.]